MTDHAVKRVVVGITGASGALYARRVIELLTAAGVEVHLTLSSLGRWLLAEELGLKRPEPAALAGDAVRSRLVTIYKEYDFSAPIASGSFLHDGMVIVPASTNTLGAVASGLTRNVLQRAAAVTLKERRTLILAHREAPLTHIDLENMQRCSRAGAIICPLAPGFYLHPTSIDELIDFMAGKILDLLNVPHDLDTRWEAHVAGTEDGDDPA
ncbi:MAG: UbiX family flavin prenyltransferase [Planctomycetota bacterium]|nr:UbiX family flavin prenyltransferase [Planctomycetota bacterium]